MGNNPGQPSISPQPLPSPQSPKKLTKPKVIKEEIVQQPKIEVVSKVALKEVDISFQLTKQQQNYISSLKNSIQQQFKLRLMSKLHRKQIRLIFGNTQHEEYKESMLVSSRFQERSLQKLQKSCRMDLQIYSEIFQMRLKSIICQKLSKENKDNLEVPQTLNRIKQQLINLFREGMATLLGQIQGKTTVWHSLSLSRPQLINKIINFCHQQGVDSSKFDFLAKSTQL